MFKFKNDNSYLICSEENDELVIDKLFVDESERGQYKGYKLLDCALVKAQELGLNIALYAEPDDKNMTQSKLIEYYEGWGFEQDSDGSFGLMTYYI